VSGFIAVIPQMAPDQIEHIRALETAALAQPQLDLLTEHVLHAGLYARTVHMPPGSLLTGALIKLATVVVVSGDVWITGGPAEAMRAVGYHVFEAEAGRKTAFLAVRDTWITMLFPTKATTVEDAENEFTDEAHRLMSRRQSQEN
jgi:hypothetical protein